MNADEQSSYLSAFIGVYRRSSAAHKRFFHSFSEREKKCARKRALTG
jgi:hypothetical protein